jgi:hypothetical protein
MSGVNVGRWIAGGLAAGILMWFMEGAASVLYMEQMKASLAAHGLAMDISPRTFVLSVVASLLAGLVLVFLYAAARPRFGPGPRTALLVGVAVWVGGYVLSLLGYLMLGLFPISLLAMWGLIGLVEILLASLLGGWIYREATPAA